MEYVNLGRSGLKVSRISLGSWLTIGTVIDRPHSEALVAAAVRAERAAAIEGGTMDQTIIVFGEAGSAVRLDFDPPARRPVPLPEGLVCVAAYSGERAPQQKLSQLLTLLL